MIALVLPHRSWWLASELWLDKSFVTMLNTGWFSKSLRVVPRWSDADHKKMKRDCSLGLFKYTKLMGCVDRVNKEVASARMALGKCPRRFQRQLFLASDFPVVGLVNVRIAFSPSQAKETSQSEDRKALSSAPPRRFERRLRAHQLPLAHPRSRNRARRQCHEFWLISVAQCLRRLLSAAATGRKFGRM